MSLLHLVPVVTSTVSAWFAFDQFYFLTIFLDKTVEPHTKHVLTPYWKTFVRTGIPLVVAPLIVTIGSTAAILTSDELLLRGKGSHSWYMASAALAAGHFLFVPLIMPKIKQMDDGGLTPALRGWMRVHVSRALTVDLLCWVACIVAATKTLSAAA